MTCPKCEIGKIVKVLLKMSGEKASLCDYCNTLWLEDEEINNHSGITLDIARRGDDIEYAIEESEEKDQDHRSVYFPKYK